jgi:methylenetetrahydrofolate dehydrogenase (NADP+)/methenyltetrahydrofolate cyclohydrolase
MHISAATSSPSKPQRQLKTAAPIPAWAAPGSDSPNSGSGWSYNPVLNRTYMIPIMAAQLIDGNLLSQQLRGDVARRAAALTAQGRQPGLAVILVGDSPASQVYVRNKVKACEDNGIYSVLEKYDADLSEAALLARIDALNCDPKIHGILVQLPLPAHIDPVRGANAVVVGASNIVGKPQAMLLLQAGATVTICNSKTRDLASHTKNADILVVATGRRNIVTADMVKPGAVVIDVGMNRDDHGKLCGDVDFANVKEVAGYITPVPGGVGPMTITMLLVNTIEAAERN